MTHRQNAVKPTTAGDAFALWIAQNQPDLFKALLQKTAEQHAHRRGTGLSGITDWLSTVGSSIGSAAKNVGSFLSSPEGMKSLTSLSSVYLQTQAQKDALRIQLAYAQSGQAPAPVQMMGTAPGTQTPYYIDPNTGLRMALTPQLTNQLLPQQSFETVLPWILGGGGVLLLLFVMSGNRR